ncbi:hypothetical protein ACFQY7_45785 [Actinomadura luteofluorescens]|uniref:hypothetical protein n=1 Tax=Actinomadura luteofluorescens TaxID=46163 RepID=UPI00363E1B0A
MRSTTPGRAHRRVALSTTLVTVAAMAVLSLPMGPASAAPRRRRRATPARCRRR